ncbi:MAG: hypothetical protein HC904_00265 [Blastochloris sp.]|nr:hypothetical protein [Blastochloris sp.]
MSIIPFFSGLIASAISFTLLYKRFFGTENDFWECVFYAFKPDFFSWMDKDLQKDYGKSLKLGFFLAIVFGAGFLTYLIVEANIYE